MIIFNTFNLDFFNPCITDEGIELVTEALKSTFISEGKMVARFESRSSYGSFHGDGK